MKEIRLGILGGCMNAPIMSVGKSALFHQVAARDLQERGLRLRVALQAIDDYQLEGQLESLRFLAERRGCDLLLFQIRPTFLRQASVAIWKDRTDPARPRLQPSPFYSHDLNAWAPPATLTPTNRFAALDYWLARATGLQKRAQRQIRRQLEGVVECATRELARPLMFLGPIYNQSLPGPLGCAWRQTLDRELSNYGVPVVDLGELSLPTRPDLFEADRFHLNTVGHGIVGHRLARAIESLGR